MPNAFASADAPLPSDDFSPFLLLLVLAAAVVAFVLVTIGTVLTFFVIACLVGLVLLGVFSTSALVAAVNRRVSSGIRALHYQLMALLGIVCGNALVFIASKVMSSPRSIAEICIPGSVGGLIAGLSFAAFLDALVRFFHRRFFPPPSTH